MELGLVFINKHDMAISSRNTDFRVGLQFSAVNTLSLFKDVWT